MKYWYFFCLFCLIPSAFAAESTGIAIPEKNTQTFEEGKDYFSYSEPIEVDEKTDGKIIIQSFFDYDCRNCSRVQDLLELYVQINVSHVLYLEYPIALKNNQFSARTFYALQAVGRADVSDSLMFETMDEREYRKLSKMGSLTNWLEKKGVDGRTFKEMYDSDEINLAVQQSIEMTEKYGVFTYPFVVINGKYVLTNSTLYSDDYTFAVLDFLIQKIDAEMHPTH
ncbi:thiol:disulfide interchange protein DsbA [Pasteurella langaaensis DSM 22999]|uniref:Thiol:disulfide interchange protein DsbA n=1 Tax=Alitibacter langaaensis DSM 22999 TaxID=1122935 RepID=A0A2U0SKN1_9PAST|nr:thiol:disulfide interchange protein DsbA/DsbL [Pasteurella langaaensis]PVX31916.1 thiol:disulfide interchange protein DsbA [Pasteurella langaaensis DSM 22999]